MSSKTRSTPEFTRKSEPDGQVAVFNRNQHFKFRGTPAQVDAWLAEHALAKIRQAQRQQAEAVQP